MKARLVILAALSLLLSGLAVAQSGSSWSLVANFDAPFDFVVNGTALPVGHYTVSTYSTGSTLLIKNVDTGQSAFAMNNNITLTGNPTETHETTKVVFGLNSDGRQVLHQICITGDDHTHDLTHGSEVTELVSSR